MVALRVPLILRILFYVVITSFAIVIGRGLFGGDVNGYFANLYSEGLGAFATIFIVERLLHAEERRRRHRVNKKLHFIAMLRRDDSQANSTALRKLARLHWLTDGSLHGVNLKRAHLDGAELCGVNLRCARLSHATLISARLRDADLSGVKLREAKLTNADLSGARLQEARLCGADLSGADLTAADLRGVQFDPQTILPDGTFWQPHTDLRLFTDPHCGNYWRSDDPASPAHEVETSG